MSLDNNVQNRTRTMKNGVASDDKSKALDFSDSQVSGGGGAAKVTESDPVTTTARTTVDRNGSSIDDRAKEFEVYDHPKA